MAIFSRVLVNPKDRRALRIFGSLERIHAVVARATDGGSTKERTLWRLDTDGNGKMFRLYIVSAVAPDATVLNEELGVEPKAISSCEYEPFLDRLECGQERVFRLTANPTKTLPSEGFVTRGSRTPLVKVDDQEEWIFDKLRKAGCHMTINRLEQPELRIRDSGLVSFRRKSSRVTLVRATFEGILAIDDPDRLRRALVEGIGPAKAYGCGLMTLAPLVTRAPLE